jgi:energy-coupling factor transporter transmembrane protein EcfT
MARERIYARKFAYLYLLSIIIITLTILILFYLYFNLILSIVIIFFLLVILAKKPGLLKKIIKFIGRVFRSIYHPFTSKYKAWNQGAKGEEIVGKWLETLGDDYFILNDVMLPGDKGNIDHIVLGKTGIFVIETKTHKGQIFCNGDRWIQKKIGRGGGYYNGNIGSPSRQAKGKAMALRKFFERYYPKLSGIWINAIVVFANINSSLHIRNQTVPVLKLPQLVDFIKTRNENLDINYQDFLEIKNFLNK